MVQIEAPRTPECQKGIPSQGGQCREEHRVVHHVQEEHYQNDQLKCVCVIVKVQLVTHSIIPNLNSGLVPISPEGLRWS